MADLNWIIEKIVDCKGNDITTGGWVTVKPMNGVGNTHASISVEPSTKYNDCETATITIATGTGEKKYVTINRCNPQCDCNAIEFAPLEVSNISENGGTVPVATYSMKYGCTDAYMGIVNTKSGCDYNITNGTVYAIVDKNPSTTSDRNFEYKVTYNGENCNGNSFQGSFTQNRSIDPCENEDCETSITLEPEDFWVDYKGEIKTIFINASDCWEVRAQTDSYDDAIESITFNKDETESYITFSKNNSSSEEPREGLVKYFFTNRVTGKECEKSITYSQYANPNPPASCDNCDIIDSNSLVTYTLEASYPASASGTKALAKFNIDSNCTSTKFWFASNPGVPSDIIDRNKINKIFTTTSTQGVVTVLANYGGGTGIIYDNDSTTTKRKQEILCGINANRSMPCIIIPIEQKAKSVTPTVDCKLDVSSITFKCIDNAQNISFLVRKTNSSSSCQQLTLVYEIEGTEITGEVIVTKSAFEEINVKVQLEQGDYTVNWHNKDNDSNSGKVNLSIQDDCIQKVKIKLLITANDENLSLYHINGLTLFLRNKNTNENTYLPFTRENWTKVLIPSGKEVTFNGSPGNMCQCCFGYDGYFNLYKGEGDNPFNKLYKEIEINPLDYHLTDDELSNYDFYVVELYCFPGLCGDALCSENQLWSTVTRSPVPVDWSAYKSMLIMNNDNAIQHTNEFFDECTGTQGGECTNYRTRICYKVDSQHLSADYFYDEDTREGLIEIMLLPTNTTRMAVRGDDDENVDELDNENVEIIDNER